MIFFASETIRWSVRLGLFLLIGTACVARAGDDVPTPPRAARSVHLVYQLPPTHGAGCTAFYAEETVLQTVPDSYFQALGFSNGYFGIQDLGERGKVAIFSVWDPAKGNDPRAVQKEDQVEMLYVGENVRAKRFGGEGTGAQSFFDYGWKTGTPVRFYLTATAFGRKTAYAAYIQLPGEKSGEKGWKHLATFRTASGGNLLRGLYSFIEDFRRDTQSATEVRRAVYANLWVRDKAGNWLPVTRATFTASGSPWEAKETIDAGVIGDQFYLQTGGDTQKHTPLESVLERPQDPDAHPPIVPADPPTAPN